MNTILQQVQLYLTEALRGEADIDETLAEEFGEACKEIIKKSFSPRKEDEFRYYMSTVGKPLCQLQMEKAGAGKEEPEYNLKMKFLLGDLIEAAAITIMKAAGVNIEDEQKPVQVDIHGQEIRGKLDVQIDGSIWDVKSASSYSFGSKFASVNGVKNLLEDDPFGYVTQGALYEKDQDHPFKGWIAINKETGEWAVLELPTANVDTEVDSAMQQGYRKAEGNVQALLDNVPFERCFEAVPEHWKKKATGRYYLDRTCVYCPFKRACWGTLTHRPQVDSKARNPKWLWYLGEV